MIEEGSPETSRAPLSIWLWEFAGLPVTWTQMPRTVRQTPQVAQLLGKSSAVIRNTDAINATTVHLSSVLASDPGASKARGVLKNLAVTVPGHGPRCRFISRRKEKL